jgi:glycosyltransferase involved in cell wall biosynthesis
MSSILASHGPAESARTERGGLSVHHFGPDPAQVGGMGTVIRILVDHRVGAGAATGHATWRSGSHAQSARLTAQAARLIALMPRRTVIHVHLSERGSFLREGSLLMLAQARGLPTVATIHGASFLDFAHHWRRLTSSVLGATDLITCLDPAVLALARTYAPCARVELVPNPVVMDDGAPDADRTAETVLFAGEISHRKGADVMHRAWQEVARARPNARCLMVGPRTELRLAPAERLEIRREVDAGAMRAHLREARAVCLPSRAEGMPMLLTEAMSAGRPFVSTPVGGIPDLAREGGILVPVGDASSLSQRLIELLANPRLARTLGDRAREFCRSTRSVQVIDARMRQLYLKAL